MALSAVWGNWAALSERIPKVLPTNYYQLGMQASASSGPIQIYGVHISFEGDTALFLLWHKSQNFTRAEVL